MLVARKIGRILIVRPSVWNVSAVFGSVSNTRILVLEPKASILFNHAF